MSQNHDGNGRDRSKKDEKIPFDPKLKMAASEIQAILEKYEIAGFAVLHCPTHTEFLMKIDPPYSCVGLKGKSLDIKEPLDTGDEADRNRTIAQTVNMIANLNIVGGKVCISLGQARSALIEHFKIEPPKVKIFMPPQN